MDGMQLHRCAPALRTILSVGNSVKQFRCMSSSSRTEDPRLAEVGHVIEDDYAVIRSTYQTPKHPIILAHGLLGFDELHLAGSYFPGIRYWRGITEALAAKDVEVITAAVPPSGRIETRAERLAETIAQKAGGKAVNIVA